MTILLTRQALTILSMSADQELTRYPDIPSPSWANFRVTGFNNDSGMQVLSSLLGLTRFFHHLRR